MVENKFIFNENTGIFLRVPVGKPTKHFGEANGFLTGNDGFPRWEWWIPMVGTMDSHGGNDGFPWWELHVPIERNIQKP